MIEQYYPGRTFEESEFSYLEKSGYFLPAKQGDPYTIVLPPPNVTGTLHMGHAFQATLIDILIRYHRMHNHSCLWQPGTDHAGIATQLVVSRKLRARGIEPNSMNRADFISEVWKWKKESGDTILNQFKRLFTTADWSNDCFTMDPSYQKAVETAFITLYREGLIFRGERLVNWDTQLQTAVSDLEVIHQEEEGFLYYLEYKIDAIDSLIVATTRPETLFGDVAVAVHPEDTRYQKFIGKSIAVPLTSRAIPIIAEDSIDPAFGTGVVKITPGHDFNDFATSKKHSLPILSIFNKSGHCNENTHPEIAGKTVVEARTITLRLLEENYFLSKVEPYTMKVPRGDRSGTIIEPLVTKQWFVDLTSAKGKQLLVQPAIEALQQGELTLLPDEWNANYQEWLNTIQDWCISRQILWGHQIPVWYDNAGNHYVGSSEAEVRSSNQLSEEILLTQDKDVLDTWFSSALWPFASLGWPQSQPPEGRYPNSILVTGFDILFFWVIRMVMFGCYFKKKVPFSKVYLHGLVRDGQGNKMSKSKGNSIDPIDVIDGISLDALLQKRLSGVLQDRQKKEIEKATKKHFPNGIAAHGIDALRFSFASMSNNGRDIRFDLNRIEGYKHFCNKLWNAGKFLNQSIDLASIPEGRHDTQLDIRSQWIASRFHSVLLECENGIALYRFDRVAHALYHFTWNDFCSWYLEWIKPDIKNNTALAASTTWIFRSLLSALAPLLPCTTAALWKSCNPSAKNLVVYPYPSHQLFPNDAPILQSISHCQQIVTAVRNFKDQMAIPLKKEISICVKESNPAQEQFLANHSSLLTTLLKNDSITLSTSQEHKRDNIVLGVGTCDLMIDYNASAEECAKQLTALNSKIEKNSILISRLENTLTNDAFVENAPPDILANYKEKLHEARRQKESFENLKHGLTSLGKS